MEELKLQYGVSEKQSKTKLEFVSSYGMKIYNVDSLVLINGGG